MLRYFDVWLTPPKSCLKLNCDAAVMDSWVGPGWILRDVNGSIMEMGVKRMEVRWEVEFAEVEAICLALQHVCSRGYKKIIV